jgi:hypothetical protein
MFTAGLGYGMEPVIDVRCFASNSVQIDFGRDKTAKLTGRRSSRCCEARPRADSARPRPAASADRRRHAHSPTAGQ